MSRGFSSTLLLFLSRLLPCLFRRPKRKNILTRKKRFMSRSYRLLPFVLSLKPCFLSRLISRYSIKKSVFSRFTIHGSRSLNFCIPHY